MSYEPRIDRLYSFSLTDFHDFDTCPFKFFVKHHLNKKYEIEDSTFNTALGCVLDQAIKLFHEIKAYDREPEALRSIIKVACNQMLDQIKRTNTPSFYSNIKDFLNDELCAKAADIFVSYYKARDCRIRPAIEPIGFCKWVIETENGRYQLWGGPDTLEMGDDGIPEIVDYKSRENLEKGKMYMDMDLMPKIYTLLCCKKLLAKGYKKARFVVRYWQDPLDESFYEEFDLEEVCTYEEIFKQRIQKILSVTETGFCEKGYCSACQSQLRDVYVKQLETMGIKFIKVGTDEIVTLGATSYNNFATEKESTVV